MPDHKSPPEASEKGAHAPDWPPRISALGLADGYQRHGSTGQLFEVRNQQWVRVADVSPDVEG